jgi:hypothetical protein
MTQELFEVVDGDGLVRRGILTTPAGRPRAALLLMSAGLKYRTGPGQLYVSLARRLAQEHIATLRIDALGIGESDDALEAGHCHDLWRTVESGRFVPDAILAFQGLRERLGPATPIYLGGLCGGGLTALVAADVLLGDGPAGVISLNIAARMTPEPGRRPAPVASEARAHLASYSRKLVSAAAWKRVLTGSTSYAAVALSVSALMPRQNRPDSDSDDLNPLFAMSFRRLRDRGVPHLLIFSGQDERWYHFTDLVLHADLSGEMHGPFHQVHVIADAEHHLMRPEWRDEAAAQISAWIAGAGAPRETRSLGTIEAARRG